MRQGEVYVNGVKAGLLSETDSGKYEFRYYSDYLSDSGNPAVSLTLPLDPRTYKSEVLFPFFFNMLSEGENRSVQSRLLHIDPEDDFGILLATCGSDTIGNVTVKSIA